VCAVVILLVDDDESVRKSLHRLLDAHGYEVYEASDRVGALAQARARHPQIMILDLHIPGCSGLQIARAVREDAILGAIGLIAFSASVPDWEEDLKLFDGVVAKPAPAEVLLGAISRTLERLR
jgi:two-component system, cell cycle response regulator DivK